MSRDARTIQETREAVLVIVRAFHLWQDVKGSGTVKKLFELGALLPALWVAFDNAEAIRAEVADLDGLEWDELIAMVSSVINSQIETNEMRRKIDKILIAFHALADAVAQWQGINPPRAEVVP